MNRKMLNLCERKQKRLKSHLISLAERCSKINREMEVLQNNNLLVLIGNNKAIPRNMLSKEKWNQRSSFGGTVAQIKVKFRVNKNQNCHKNPRRITCSIGEIIKESTIMVKLKEKQIGRTIDFHNKTQ